MIKQLDGKIKRKKTLLHVDTLLYYISVAYSKNRCRGYVSRCSDSIWSIDSLVNRKKKKREHISRTLQQHSKRRRAADWKKNYPQNLFNAIKTDIKGKISSTEKKLKYAFNRKKKRELLNKLAVINGYFCVKT